jgi:CBS domain-containing protein
MAENDVGTVVVVEPNFPNEALGIVTDRDITIRGVAPGLSLDITPISQIMTTPVHSVPEHTPLEQAVARMASTASRRLVVTGEQNRPVGILSLDDVLGLISVEAASIGRLLKQQQPHLRAEQPATA